MKKTKPVLVVNKSGPKPRLRSCANGCPRFAFAKGLCNPCYQRSRLPVLTEEMVERVVRMAKTDSARDIAAVTGLPASVVHKLTRHLPPPALAPERVVYDLEAVRRTVLDALMKDAKPNPMEVARAAFEQRLTEGSCLKLDGVPVTYYELMRRANKELRRFGLPLLTACEAWL